MEKPHIFLVADVVAQQAMAGIKRWNCTSEDPVCWVCGKCRAHCDRDFGKGLSPILSDWTWYRQVLRSIVPKYRPPDYALHGVTRVTHSGLDGCWRALVQHHRFTKRRAITWVQTHVNPCRVASHSVAPQDIPVCALQGIAARWLSAHYKTIARSIARAMARGLGFVTPCPNKQGKNAYFSKVSDSSGTASDAVDVREDCKHFGPPLWVVPVEERGPFGGPS